MKQNTSLLNKLEKFIRKFHWNEILRGVILFLSIGLLYFLLTLLIEHFFWLPKKGRQFLFWSFILVELALLYRWVLIPLTKILKIRKGIDNKEAAVLIGNHFPEVSDKLLNTLELQEMQESELLLASIEQKTQEMQAVSFEQAVSFASNKKYLPYFLLPLGVFLLSFLFADSNWFKQSYERVSNYNMAYTPPAPYYFIIENDSLKGLQHQDFNLIFSIEGKTIPEDVSIAYEDKNYSVRLNSDGLYQHTFSNPKESIEFQLIGNQHIRQEFELEISNIPLITDLEIEVQAPAHTQIPKAIHKGKTHIQIPEGSQVTWNLLSQHADEIQFKDDSIQSFLHTKNGLTHKEQIRHSKTYEIAAKNKETNYADKLQISIQSIPDAYPSIQVETIKDSIHSNLYHFSGIVEDDYGLKKLEFIIQNQQTTEVVERFDIPLQAKTLDRFAFSFNSDTYLENTGTYSFYFQITDNDAVNGFKTSRSDVGSLTYLAEEEVKEEQLELQSDKLEKLSEQMDSFKQENSTLEELEELDRTAEQLKWEDAQKLDAFTKQEKLSLEQIEKLTEDLSKNLEQMKTSPSFEKDKNQLQERMQEQLEDLKKNQEKLEELQKLQNELSNEELIKEIEEYKQQKEIQEKNLNQLLELTRRFYIAEKQQKLASDLHRLGEKQEQLPEDEVNNTKEEQEKLQEQFDKFKDELNKLQQENQKLLRPMGIYQDKSAEKQISDKQQDASDKLENNQGEEAKPSQQDAGQQMKNLALAMQQQQGQGGMEALSEDINVLRQILDNLVRFSFSQEEVLEIFSSINFGHPKYGTYLTNQHDLKQNFRHINDSLFSLSLRQPMMGKKIHQHTTEINDHIDVALDDLAQNRMGNGIAQQQYALVGANELAVMLSDILDNMQMQMSSSSGSGGDGEKFQLSDIIEEQESLMEGDDGEGEDDGDSEGDSEGDSDSGDEGEDGESGESGEEGSEGEEGSSDGKSGQSGEDGQLGEGDFYMDEEGEDGSYYELYKRQQELKFQLEDYIRSQGLDIQDVKGILDEMDDLSFKLLQTGNYEASRRQMKQILHKLLELEKANLEQDEKEEREATTNFKDFMGNTKSLNLIPLEKLPSLEILNRESLPFKPFYKNRISDYFKN